LTNLSPPTRIAYTLIHKAAGAYLSVVIEPPDKISVALMAPDPSGIPYTRASASKVIAPPWEGIPSAPEVLSHVAELNVVIDEWVQLVNELHTLVPTLEIKLKEITRETS
jgi:hypothetical protein